MFNQQLLQQVLRRPDSWRGGSPYTGSRALSTGIASLDELLNGGWPLGALIDLLPRRGGIGEISLLLPALQHYCRENQLLVWLNPPCQPCAQTLADCGLNLQQLLVVYTRNRCEWLWTAEQCIRGNALLLAWAGRQSMTYNALRKLQLAAVDSGMPAFLFNSPRTLAAPSPAVLRLELDSRDHYRLLTLHKLRGKAPGAQLRIALPHHLLKKTEFSRLPVDSYFRRNVIPFARLPVLESPAWMTTL